MSRAVERSKRPISALIGNSTEFPILRQQTFLDHAATSPLCAAAARAQANHVHRATMEPPSWPRLAPAVAAVRSTCADLIGANPLEIAFVKNTSEGLSTAAFGLNWRKGDRVVVTGAEFASNLYPWLEVGDRYGVDVVVVPETTGADAVRRVPVDRLMEEMSHPQTRVVTLSHVEYASGQRFDLRSLGQFCRRREILFCVDAIQSLGVFPIDVHEMCIDVLATDGHKWLLAPAGAGFLDVRSEVQSEIRPLSIGWRNVRNKPVASMDAVALVGGAERYEAGSLNVAALIGLDAAVKLLWSVGIDRIKARVDTLTTRLCEALTSSGYVVVSPRQPGEGSGIVSFLSRTATSREVAKALRSRSIKVSVRDELVRVSPHFYNSDEQIGQLVAELPR